jgi:prepilin-type N-terminal cleavage/methylation domain-containing protein
MRKIFLKNNNGYTLIEMVISIGILTAIMGAVAIFQTDIFSLNDYIDRGIRDQAEAKNLMKHFVREVRSASESEQGAYPIKQADPATFIFYSDIDFDSVKEEVRYFIDDGILKKGVIEPEGDPLTYDSGDEKITNVVVSVINESPFTYFDENYTGSSTDFLVEPFTVSQIRMVGIDLVVDSDPENPPQSFEIGTQINVRNLRDR